MEEYGVQFLDQITKTQTLKTKLLKQKGMYELKDRDIRWIDPNKKTTDLETKQKSKEVLKF